MSIYELLADQATLRPEATAMIAPDRHPLSYQELFAQIESTMTALNARGIGRNDRVALVLPDGPETAVCFLAVSAAATSAPLNPRYRAEELDFYLADLRARGRDARRARIGRDRRRQAPRPADSHALASRNRTGRLVHAIGNDPARARLDRTNRTE